MPLQDKEGTFRGPQKKSNQTNKVSNKPSSPKKDTLDQKKVEKPKQNNADIQNQINKINGQMSEARRKCENLREQLLVYRNCLKQTDTINNKIVEINRNTSIAEGNFKKYYVVDGKIADNGKLGNIRDHVKSGSDKLNNVLVPAIKNKILELETKISNLESEISGYGKKIDSLRRQLK